MPDYPIISADDHIDLQWLPRDLWSSRAPSKLRDKVPQVKTTEQGTRWYLGDQIIGIHGPLSATETKTGGRRAALERGDALRQGEFRPTTPALRLADMARDGIYTSVLYGPVNPLIIEDPEIRRFCYRAYNDWLSEFCSAAPGRFLGVGMLPHDNPKEAAEEIHHLAEKKIPEGMLLGAQVSIPLFDSAWEPLWAAAEEAGVAIGFHLGGGLRSMPDMAQRKEAAHFAFVTATVQTQLDEPLCAVILSGALERHPGLKIILAESGVGWLPYILERMEHGWDQILENRAYWTDRGGLPLKLRPKEYFQRQVWATFQEDPIGIRLLDILGSDRVMWASDYPHIDGTWPNSMKAIEEQFGKLSEADRRRITSENARNLYGLP